MSGQITNSEKSSSSWKHSSRKEALELLPPWVDAAQLDVPVTVTMRAKQSKFPGLDDGVKTTFSSGDREVTISGSFGEKVFRVLENRERDEAKDADPEDDAVKIASLQGETYGLASRI